MEFEHDLATLTRGAACLFPRFRLPSSWTVRWVGLCQLISSGNVVSPNSLPCMSQVRAGQKWKLHEA